MHCTEWYKQKLELTNTELELEYLKQQKKITSNKISRWLIGIRITIWQKYIKKLKKRMAYIEEHEDD